MENKIFIAETERLILRRYKKEDIQDLFEYLSDQEVVRYEPYKPQTFDETEKSLVLLFYMEDLPIKKISDITGIPQGTVKVYLARSRTKMAKILETDESNR